MPRDDHRHDTDAADRLNAIWDRHATSTGGQTAASQPVSSGDALLTEIERFHAMDDTPPPDPTFATRLRRDLLEPPRVAPRRDSAQVGIVPGAGRPWLVELIAAAAIVLFLAGGQLAGHGFGTTFGPSPTMAAEEATGTAPSSADCPGTGIAPTMPAVLTMATVAPTRSAPADQPTSESHCGA